MGAQVQCALAMSEGSAALRRQSTHISFFPFPETPCPSHLTLLTCYTNVNLGVCLTVQCGLYLQQAACSLMWSAKGLPCACWACPVCALDVPHKSTASFATSLKQITPPQSPLPDMDTPNYRLH